MKREDGSWEVFEDYVLDYAIDCPANGKRYVLMTLVGIEESSPRFLGAKMAVSESGSFVGYLSGGCIERAIVSEALDALNRLVRCGQGSWYFDIQLPCGSGIDLYFDVSQPTSELSTIDFILARRLGSEMEIRLRARPDRVEQLIRVEYMPRRRLLIAGGGPFAVRLCGLATLSGFDVWSADDETRDEAKCLNTKVVELVSLRKVYEIIADCRSAIVFMFHDHLWEENLFPSVFVTKAYYRGVRGSKATHFKGPQKLPEKGFSPDQINNIRGSVGVFGGAKSAPDIAILILADIVKDEREGIATGERAHVGSSDAEIHAHHRRVVGRLLS